MNELKVFSGRAHPDLTSEICERLGVPVGSADVFKFSNNNTFVRILESVREDDVFVVQPSCYPVNDGFMELIIMMDALRRASVRRITAVLPIFPYSRSDKKDQPRIAITARLIADILEVSGANRVLTMDLHSAQLQGFFRIPVDHLTAIPILADYVAAQRLSDLVVVAPDAGRAKMARAYADRLRVPMAIIDKRRAGNDETVEVDQVVGDVSGCHVLLVDDEVSSGRSLVAAAETAARHGAKRIWAAVTHPVLTKGATALLERSPLERLIVTNTVPISTEKQSQKIVILSVAPLFAEAMRRIHTGESVSTLFQDV